MSYTHFTLEERKYLQKLLSEGLSMRKIADILERSPSTISREIKRNKTKNKPKRSDNPYCYNHWRAQILYTCRRRTNKLYAFKPDTDEWDFTVDGLNKFWSPEAICGRWKKLFPNRKPLHFPQSIVISHEDCSPTFKERRISDGAGSEFRREMPITTPSNRIVLYRNGLPRYATEAESVTGKATRYTAG